MLRDNVQAAAYDQRMSNWQTHDVSGMVSSWGLLAADSPPSKNRLLGIRSFLKTLGQHFKNLPVPTTDCTGKIAVVTGATGGLGLEAARHFARLNAGKLILGCRSVERGEAAKKSIERSLPQLGPDVIEVWAVDLGSFESVQEFCARVAGLGRVDYVLENAGLATGVFKELEGYEETITVNVLSTFLMALLLLPILRNTAARHNVTPHLTIVASDAHYFTAFPQRKEQNILQSLKGDTDIMNRYYISKLLVVLIARRFPIPYPFNQLTLFR